LNILTFTRDNYHSLCDGLAKADPALAFIINQYGYPPYWSRPNTFESLVHIILEQQVSLASALSALHKLKEKIHQVTPSRILLLTDEEFKACYFSRQKTAYVKYLAEALTSKKLDLDELTHLSDVEVRSKLTTLKGIGNWTVDIYLLMILHRTNIFPVGDLAIINAVKKLIGLPAATTKEEILMIAEAWQPYRSIAAMLLWHYYLSKPRLKA
jgi:DNA-3-methyladenine glycosylase II